MTTDEVVRLLEALLEGVNLSELRNGPLEPLTFRPDDEQYVLLVRFLAGERPQTSPPPAAFTTGPKPGHGPVPDWLEHEDEVPPRKFDMTGITLP